MSRLLTGGEILCRTLLDAGVDVLFGYPGGAIMPFYDALHGHAALRHILVRHEQAAAHAADGYARASNRVGVCVATSGPGATNLVTGLATAHMDGSPVLAITGQVSRPMLGRDAFQETDVVGVTSPSSRTSCARRWRSPSRVGLAPCSWTSRRTCRIRKPSTSLARSVPRRRLAKP